MKNSQIFITPCMYQASPAYVGGFYLILSAWTIVSIYFMGMKGWYHWTQIFMIAFIFIFTWYFSLGIFYRIYLEENGTIQMVSVRRLIRTHPMKIEMVEGPPLPIGFLRFRLEREKAYVFYVAKNRELEEILSLIRKINPDIRFKNLSLQNGKESGLRGPKF